MMRAWALLHLVSASAWAGCVMTELVAEKWLLQPGDRARLAGLHWQIDRWVELPLAALALLAGVRAWPGAAADAGLRAMAAAGGVAMLANAVCSVWVWRRWQAARLGDPAAHAHADRWQHRWGALVALGLGLALGAAAWRATA
ncbi:hypothetical protein [Ideonella alba]|uniref:Copper resistance protein D domain-containing protein n=1 Tax=Ideonella alba TaxID=2824118 RepID=A0A941BDU2_9BURK|nr:hypothetical protein [Ideonella alba]MBQ0929267.1 hypothetical protein [Ideonella alba]